MRREKNVIALASKPIEYDVPVKVFKDPLVKDFGRLMEFKFYSKTKKCYFIPQNKEFLSGSSFEVSITPNQPSIK